MLARTLPSLRPAGFAMLGHLRAFSKQHLAGEVANINQELDELFGRQFVPYQPLESPFLRLPNDIQLPRSGSQSSLSSRAGSMRDDSHWDSPHSSPTLPSVTVVGEESVVFVDSSGAEVEQDPPSSPPPPKSTVWNPAGTSDEMRVQEALHAQPLESPFLHIPADVHCPLSAAGLDPSPALCASSPAVEQAAPILTHVDPRGQASMVDVGQKVDTERVATASGRVLLGPQAFSLVQANQIRKGDVLTVAKLAGMMGAKQTSLLIPLCHNINLTQVDVQLDLEPSEHAVVIQGTAKAFGKTGVEMEALTAVSVAALTVYDMCKAVSKDVVIDAIQLEAKSGGRSGDYRRVRF